MRKVCSAVLGLALLPGLTQAAAPGATGNAGNLVSPVLLGLIILLIGVGFTAAMLVTQLAVPGLVRRSALLVRRTPGRSLLYGLLVTVIVLLGLAAARATADPVGKLVSTVLILPWLALVVIGLAAASYSLGEGLLTASGSPHEGAGPWAAGSGAALLTLINLLPALGQVVLLLAMLAGVGAVTRQLLTRPPPEAVPTDAARGAGA